MSRSERVTAPKVEKVAREISKVVHEMHRPADAPACPVCLSLARWHLREIAKAERRGVARERRCRVIECAASLLAHRFMPTTTSNANPVTVKVAKRRKR